MFATLAVASGGSAPSRWVKPSPLKFLVSATFVALFPVTSLLAAEQGSAIDAQGVRHAARDYSGRPVPWRGDITKSVAPEYSYEDRTRHHEGSGLFRLTLDLKTGFVTDVLMIRSTGFKGLDASGVKSLRQWRWRPGTWRQIDIPLTFTMSRNSDLEQPSSPFMHVPVVGRTPRTTMRLGAEAHLTKRSRFDKQGPELAEGNRRLAGLFPPAFMIKILKGDATRALPSRG